jgi:hypothetical protein
VVADECHRGYTSQELSVWRATSRDANASRGTGRKPMLGSRAGAISAPVPTGGRDPAGHSPRSRAR